MIYRNKMYLDDGRVLTIEYGGWYIPATFYDPAEGERDEETTYYIDGTVVERSELPPDVTDEILEKLEAHADGVEADDDRDDDPDDDYGPTDEEIERAQNAYERRFYGD